ncbi:MAG: hypothetical protein R3F17_17110 [Planctomycetota bacterium]
MQTVGEELLAVERRAVEIRHRQVLGRRNLIHDPIYGIPEYQARLPFSVRRIHVREPRQRDARVARQFAVRLDQVHSDARKTSASPSQYPWFESLMPR